ncbi:hypothetical protein AB6Q56_04165 [Dechloromonas sp. ARDL1]|uniref:hypothetical protein n=1 Tax=Dechloromonas sp. ARDL1 TaxID=3322121 RepID=UPI003DA75724
MRTVRKKTGWDFSASVFNLFNADIREPAKIDLTSGTGVIHDLPMPRRTIWLQARYSL